MLSSVAGLSLSPAKPRRTAGAWRWSAAALAAVVCGYLALKTDWGAAFVILRHIGYAWPLILLPFLLSMVCATGAWRLVLERLGWRVSSLRLLPLRIASEGLGMAVPGGALVAEAMKPVWAHRRLGVPLTEGAASGAVIKGFGVQAHGAYLFLAFALAYAPWRGAQSSLNGPLLWLWQSLPAIALLLLVMGTLVLQGLRGGMVIKLLYSGLLIIPVSPVRRWLVSREESFSRVNGDFGRFFCTTPLRIEVLILSLSVGQWMMEAVETFIIFHLLGTELTFSQALLMEALTSVIRCLLFFLPGGLGALELTTFLLLGLFGFPNAGHTTAAFAVAKRSKEVFWIVTSAVLHFMEKTKPVTPLQEQSVARVGSQTA